MARALVGSGYLCGHAGLSRGLTNAVAGYARQRLEARGAPGGNPSFGGLGAGSNSLWGS